MSLSITAAYRVLQNVAGLLIAMPAPALTTFPALHAAVSAAFSTASPETGAGAGAAAGLAIGDVPFRRQRRNAVADVSALLPAQRRCAVADIAGLIRACHDRDSEAARRVTARHADVQQARDDSFHPLFAAALRAARRAQQPRASAPTST